MHGTARSLFLSPGEVVDVFRTIATGIDHFYRQGVGAMLQIFVRQRASDHRMVVHLEEGIAPVDRPSVIFHAAQVVAQPKSKALFRHPLGRFEWGDGGGYRVDGQRIGAELRYRGIDPPVAVQASHPRAARSSPADDPILSLVGQRVSLDAEQKSGTLVQWHGLVMERMYVGWVAFLLMNAIVHEEIGVEVAAWYRQADPLRTETVVAVPV